MKARSRGFTLTEIAIVLLIAGLLLASVLSTVSTQLDARNIRETQARLDQVKDALIGYAQANGRLPCPADGTIATGVAGAGLEQLKSVSPYDCTNANGFGVLPWATLGVAETDVWGRRFGYKVSSVFSDAVSTTATYGCTPTPTPTVSTFALCSTGTLTVTTRTPLNKAGSSVTGVPVVIISYGKNGYGAYSPDGTQIAGMPVINVDETANATPASLTFYTREQSAQTSSCSDTAAGQAFCEYDDLLAYVPVSVLDTRMVSAGKLP